MCACQQAAQRPGPAADVRAVRVALVVGVRVVLAVVGDPLRSTGPSTAIEPSDRRARAPRAASSRTTRCVKQAVEADRDAEAGQRRTSPAKMREVDPSDARFQSSTTAASERRRTGSTTASEVGDLVGAGHASWQPRYVRDRARFLTERTTSWRPELSAVSQMAALPDRPWRALPPALADRARARAARARRRDHRRDPAPRVPEYARPLRGIVRARRAPRRRGRARRLRRLVRGPAARAGDRPPTYVDLGARRVPRRPRARRAARRLPRSAPASRGGAVRPPPGRRAAATRPSLHRLAEAIFAYIDELAAESVAGYARGAVARGRRASSCAAPSSAGCSCAAARTRQALAQPRSARTGRCRARWPCSRRATRESAAPCAGAGSASRCCAPAPSCSCCPIRTARGADHARGGARRRRPGPRPRRAPQDAARSAALALAALALASPGTSVVADEHLADIALARAAGPLPWLAERRLRPSTRCPRPSASGSSRRCWRGSATAAAPRRSPPTCTSTRRPFATASPRCASCSARRRSPTPTRASSWSSRCAPGRRPRPLGQPIRRIRAASARPDRLAFTHGHHHAAGPHPHRRAHRPRGRAAQREHEGVGEDVRARARPPQRRRRLLLPAARAVADLPRARRWPEGLGRRRQRVSSTSTTASARWSRATRTRSSARPSRSATRSARTSPRRPRTRSSSATSSPSAGGCRSGATRTPAPSPRWTRSASRAPSPAATP